MFTPRPYQMEATQAVFRYWEDGGRGNPLVVAPTGSGKAFMIAHFAREAHRRAREWSRVVNVIHTRELVQQNAETLIRYWPDAEVGICSASVGLRQYDHNIVVSSIGSVYRKAKRLGHVDLLVIDECHRIPSEEENSMYMKLINELREINPHMKVVGYTATPWRARGGLLVDGPLFDKQVYSVDINFLISQKYLVKPLTKATMATLDVSGVKVRHGDYINKDLNIAVNTAAKNQAIALETFDIGVNEDRRGWLGFAVSVDHAYSLADEINQIATDRGMQPGGQFQFAEVIEGGMGGQERAALVKAFKAREFRCLINCMVATEGFDAPHIDLVFVARPTRSAGLWVQMVGRGMRPAEGKEDCRILDFGQNAERHGTIDGIDIRRPKPGEPGEAPVKVCPECEAYVHLSMAQCPECGHEFPPRDETAALDPAASKAAMLRAENGAEWVKVTMPPEYTAYRPIDKPDGPQTLRCTYCVGIGSLAREFIPFEHQRARHLARVWWGGRVKRTHRKAQVPETSVEAMRRSSELAPVRWVRVKRDKYGLKVIDASSSTSRPIEEDASLLAYFDDGEEIRSG